MALGPFGPFFPSPSDSVPRSSSGPAFPQQSQQLVGTLSGNLNKLQPKPISELYNDILQTGAINPVTPPQSLQQHADQAGIPLQQAYQVYSPQQMNEQRNHLHSQQMAGAQQAMRQWWNALPGMTSGNPYAQFNRGSTPQSIWQLAYRNAADLGREFGLQANQANADQFLRTVGAGTDIASAQANQNANMASALASLVQAQNVPYSSTLSALASILNQSKSQSGPRASTGAYRT